MTGTTPEYFDLRTWPVAHGARFTVSDVEGGTKVVLLGQQVVDKLFGASADPVGQMVRIIVGTLVEVGIGRYGADEVRQMLEARNREAAGPTDAAKAAAVTSATARDAGVLCRSLLSPRPFVMTGSDSPNSGAS